MNMDLSSYTDLYALPPLTSVVPMLPPTDAKSLVRHGVASLLLSRHVIVHVTTVDARTGATFASLHPIVDVLPEGNVCTT